VGSRSYAFSPIEEGNSFRHREVDGNLFVTSINTLLQTEFDEVLELGSPLCELRRLVFGLIFRRKAFETFWQHVELDYRSVARLLNVIDVVSDLPFKPSCEQDVLRVEMVFDRGAS